MYSNPLQQTRFINSAVSAKQYPPDSGAEVAIIGRSNSGKSSSLNALCGRHRLAKTSKRPGRTQTLNFFEVMQDRRIVDLPGYGYARVSAAEQKKWSAFIARYFANRDSLRGVVIVMDARRPLQQNDWEVIHWLGDTDCHVLLNKSDKLKRNAAAQCLKQTTAALADYPATAQLFSAHSKQGVAEARQKIAEWLGIKTRATSS